MEIIWICLSTTTLAIWVSLHLYVDSPEASKLSLRAGLEKFRDGNTLDMFDASTDWPLQWRKPFEAVFTIWFPKNSVTNSIVGLFWAIQWKRRISAIPGFGKFSLRQSFILGHCGIYYKTGADRLHFEILSSWELEEFARNGQLVFKDLPSNEELDDRSKSDRLLKSISVFQTLWFFANIIYRLYTGLPISLLEDLAAAYAFCGLVQLLGWFRCPQDISQPFFVELENPPDNYASSSDESSMNRRRDIWWDVEIAKWPLVKCVVFTLSAAVFVGVHLAAWNYRFASAVEKWLWRSCSLATLPLLFVVFIFGNYELQRDCESYWRYRVYKTITVISSSLYCLARLALISLAFAAFRKAPVGIYQDASWTDLIPHI